jgi:hypothetical protein
MKKIVVVPALVASLFVYLFYRTHSTVVALMGSFVLGDHRFQTLRSAIRAEVPLDGFAVYSLPEGLWVLCLTFASVGLSLRVGRGHLPLAFLPPVYAVGLEFAQRAGMIRGRFDPADLLVSICFWAAGILLTRSDSAVRIVKRDRPSMILAFCWSIVYLAHVCS